MMRGKICLVTGANSGLGKATALGLAELGATVVMLCRSKSRGEAALAEVREKSSNENVELMICGLSSQKAIRSFVEEFKSKYDKLHVLLNIAGISLLERRVTQDGIEYLLATNYLAPFLLTNLLLDMLRASAPARIVTVSGSNHKKGTINFDDIQYEKKFSGIKAGYQAVLAKVIFTYELARRLEGTGVTANTVAPGLTRTNLARHLPWYGRLYAFITGLFAQSPEKGAQSIIYLASSPDVEGVSGMYFKKMEETESSPESYDESIAKRLWQVSEELVGQHFD